MKEWTVCHSGVYRQKLVLFSAQRGDRLIVVDDVPALVCETCGDQILAENAAKGIELAIQGEPAYSAPIYRFPKTSPRLTP